MKSRTKAERKKLKSQAIRNKKVRTNEQNHALRSNKNFLDYFFKA